MDLAQTTLLLMVSIPLSLGHFYDIGTSYCLLPGDDDKFAEVDFPTSIDFFKNSYNKSYIGINGIVSFDAPVSSYIPQPFPRVGQKIMLSPFWTDIDTRCGGTICYQILEKGDYLTTASSEIQKIFPTFKNFTATWMLVVTWENVQEYSCFIPKSIEHSQNSFQLTLLTDGRFVFATFNYRKIDWTRDAQVGFNKGDEIHFYSVPGSMSDEVRYFTQRSNVGIPGKFIFRIDLAEIISDKDTMLCKPNNADVIFVVDISLSTHEQLSRTKNFLMDVVGNLTMASNDNRVGMVTFSDKVVQKFTLTTYGNGGDIMSHLQHITSDGRTTNVAAGLNGASALLLPAVERSSFVVLVSDGLDHRQKEMLQASSQLKARGAHVLSVGIGKSVHQKMLEELCSENYHVIPPDPVELLSYLELGRQNYACPNCRVHYQGHVHFLLDFSNAAKDDTKDMYPYFMDSLNSVSQNYQHLKHNILVSVHAYNTELVTLVDSFPLSRDEEVNRIVHSHPLSGKRGNISTILGLTKHKVDETFTPYMTHKIVLFVSERALSNDLEKVKESITNLQRLPKTTVFIVGCEKDDGYFDDNLEQSINEGFFVYHLPSSPNPIFGKILSNSFRNIDCAFD